MDGQAYMDAVASKKDGGHVYVFFDGRGNIDNEPSLGAYSTKIKYFLWNVSSLARLSGALWT